MASASEYELRVAETVDFLRSKLPARWVPEVAVVCGSGLTGLVNDVSVLVSVPYATIPHFPDSTVQGHGKSLVFGMLGGKRVVALTGRFHFYEGLVPSTVMYGVRTVAALGAKVLIVTNAAGGVNPAYEKVSCIFESTDIRFPPFELVLVASDDAILLDACALRVSSAVHFTCHSRAPFHFRATFVPHAASASSLPARLWPSACRATS